MSRLRSYGAFSLLLLAAYTVAMWAASEAAGVSFGALEPWPLGGGPGIAGRPARALSLLLGLGLGWGVPGLCLALLTDARLVGASLLARGVGLGYGYVLATSLAHAVLVGHAPGASYACLALLALPPLACFAGRDAGAPIRDRLPLAAAALSAALVIPLWPKLAHEGLSGDGTEAYELARSLPAARDAALGSRGGGRPRALRDAGREPVPHQLLPGRGRGGPARPGRAGHAPPARPGRRPLHSAQRRTRAGSGRLRGGLPRRPRRAAPPLERLLRRLRAGLHGPGGAGGDGLPDGRALARRVHRGDAGRVRAWRDLLPAGLRRPLFRPAAEHGRPLRALPEPSRHRPAAGAVGGGARRRHRHRARLRGLPRSPPRLAAPAAPGVLARPRRHLPPQLERARAGLAPAPHRRASAGGGRPPSAPRSGKEGPARHGGRLPGPRARARVQEPALPRALALPARPRGAGRERTRPARRCPGRDGGGVHAVLALRPLGPPRDRGARRDLVSRRAERSGCGLGRRRRLRRVLPVGRGGMAIRPGQAHLRPLCGRPRRRGPMPFPARRQPRARAGWTSHAGGHFSPSRTWISSWPGA